MRRHLELIGYGPGAVELVAGTNRPGNPEKIDLLVWTWATYGKGPHTRSWVPSDQLPQLARKAERLAEKWGNVYISVGTYGKVKNRDSPGTERYSREAPQSRRCFILDDVPTEKLPRLPLPPTFVTETSPGNNQVGYMAHELLPAATMEVLAKGAALLMGADGSGWDAQQLIRLAGTLNTKAKCVGRPGDPQQGIEPEGWRVRLRVEGPRHSTEALACAFLPGGLADLRGAHGADGTRGAREGRKEAYDAAAWENLPDGAALMASERYQRLFQSRPQLTALALGQRLTLPTRYGPRDTGSEQVAVLVSNLLTTRRRNEAGDFVPGLGAPPLEEIRAVALHWQETLRPGYEAARYKADIDRLLRPAPDGYQPAGYAPEATRSLISTGASVTLPTLASAKHKGPGRPIGDRAQALDRCAELLPPGGEITRASLALALGTTDRTITNYLRDLQAAERVGLERTRRGYRVTYNRDWKINSPQSETQPDEAAAESAWVETNSTGNYAAFAASECENSIGSTPPPPKPSGPEVAAASAPEYVPDPEPMAASDVGSSPGGAVCAPPCPTPAVAETAEAAEERIMAAVVQVRYAFATMHIETRRRLDPDTGEVFEIEVEVVYLGKATRGRVQALLPDMPPHLFEAGWRRYNDPWGRERRRLWELDTAGLAAAARTAARKHAEAVKRRSGQVNYFAALAEIAIEVCARRGVNPAEPTIRKPRKGKKAARQEAQERVAAVPQLLRLFEEDQIAPASLRLPASIDRVSQSDAAPHTPEEPCLCPPAQPQPNPSWTVVARPRVQLERPAVPEASAPAQARGYSAAECDAWLVAQGWRYEDGQWIPPSASPMVCAD